MRISLVMIDRTVPGMNDIIEKLQKDFAADVHLDMRSMHFSRAYDTKRKQWNAESLLKELAPFRSPFRKTIYIFREDMFVPGLTFVFGLTVGDMCIVSTTRLDPRFYGKVKDMKAAGMLFRKRLVKEIVHELGHTMGMQHCDDKKCVMVYSHGIKDVDNKKVEFCKKCRKEFRAVL